MLSAVILPKRSYSAVLLAEQQIHQRFVLSGPLVLRKSSLKQRRLHQIGNQPVSRILVLHLALLSRQEPSLLKGSDYNFF